MANDGTVFFPVGHRCSTVALLDACGLSSKTMAFDSMISQLSVIRDCLENDFKEFLNPTNYRKVHTRTVNIIDGAVEEACVEYPSVNWYYEQAHRAIGDNDLTNTSTYHLQLAFTHEDPSDPNTHATMLRRSRRMLDVLKEERNKIAVHIAPVLGLTDYTQKKAELTDEFVSFADFLASRYSHTCGLFFLIVKLREPAPEENSELIFKNERCSVYTIYANSEFIDAGAPFEGNREHEVETIKKILQRENLERSRSYTIYFPLFDHVEGASNEMRLTHEGLLDHPRVKLVDRPSTADYIIFCQNHLVDSNPFAHQFRPIKDRFKEKTIFLDYDDNPYTIYDEGQFRWRLYFKRSIVDRENGRVVDYGNLPIRPTAYAVLNDMCDPPGPRSRNSDWSRRIDVSCLFDDDIVGQWCFALARGRLLTFAKRFASNHPELVTQVGTVSECGPVGRSAINPKYKEYLYGSKIVLHANPDAWEGDSRLWEALASGALVFVDRMVAPIEHPPEGGEHLIFYDVTDEGLQILERKILYYLAHEDERARIGQVGREFVLQHHRSRHRLRHIIDTLERTGPPVDTLERTGPPVVSAPKGTSSLDIIVSIATGYKDIGSYTQFIATLRKTGATCPILLGISDGPEFEPIKKYLLENSANYFIVPPISPGHKVCYGYRFAQYRNWLRHLDFRYAMMLDFRDAYFQKDPFIDIDRFMHDCDLYLMSEFHYLTVGNHPNGMNYAWVAEPFGSDVADAIKDKPILNSGALLGRKSAVMTFLDAIADITTEQNYEFADQGTLNYLAHTGRLDHCGRIKIEPAGVSLVNNCGFTELDELARNRPLSKAEESRIAFIPRTPEGRLKLHRDHEGWVLDDDGNVSYVVHQYDRFHPDIDDLVNHLKNHECPDRIFVPGEGRRYHAEKYTLSLASAAAVLKPGATRWLVDTMKNLPVYKKPLLILNHEWKHGFLFGYGTLHIDLLFEAKELRQEFFGSTLSPRERKLFCTKWGYELVVVDEREIFHTQDPEKVEAADAPLSVAQTFKEARKAAERW